MPLTTAEVSDDGVIPIEVPGFATVRTNLFAGASEALASSAAATPRCRASHLNLSAGRWPQRSTRGPPVGLAEVSRAIANRITVV